MYLYIFLFTKPLKSSTLAADFKIEMKNISILYIMKQLLVSIAIVFASILTVTGQNHSFSLSGKWNFQIDREDIGTKEQWFKKSLDDQINLPGSMPEKLKGDNDALLTRINTSVDLDYVYKVATEELGMVYANKDQVRLYNKTESEYVRQYEDIPER